MTLSQLSGKQACTYLFRVKECVQACGRGLVSFHCIDGGTGGGHFFNKVNRLIIFFFLACQDF